MKNTKILISALLLAAITLSSTSCAGSNAIENNDDTENITETTVATDEPDFISVDNLVTYGFTKIQASYRNPPNGTFIYSDELKGALKNHAGDNSVFLVTIDIFADEEISNIGRAMAADEVAREYEKLASSDIEFHLVKYRSIDGNLAPYDDYLCALMSEEQLTSFEPDPSYGYWFNFLMSECANDHKIYSQRLSTYDDFIAQIPETSEREVIIYGDTFDMLAQYESPKNGEVLCYEGLKRTIERHRGENIYYLIDLDLTSFDEDGNLIEICDGEILKQEFTRLSDLGIQFCEASTWFYSEDPMMHVIPDGTSSVYALMSEDQIENFEELFEPRDEFGYRMQMTVSGTNTIIRSKDIRPITDFSTFPEEKIKPVYL